MAAHAAGIAREVYVHQLLLAKNFPPSAETTTFQNISCIPSLDGHARKAHS